MMTAGLEPALMDFSIRLANSIGYAIKGAAYTRPSLFTARNPPADKRLF